MAACCLGAVALSGFAADGELAREPGSVLLARCEAALRMLRPEAVPDSAEREQGLACIAFVDGFLFGHGWAAWRENRDAYYCPPEGLTASSVIPRVVEYLQQHPDRLDAPAHVLLFSALGSAFPCEPASQK